MLHINHHSHSIPSLNLQTTKDATFTGTFRRFTFHNTTLKYYITLRCVELRIEVTCWRPLATASTSHAWSKQPMCCASPKSPNTSTAQQRYTVLQKSNAMHKASVRLHNKRSKNFDDRPHRIMSPIAVANGFVWLWPHLIHASLSLRVNAPNGISDSGLVHPFLHTTFVCQN